MMHLGGNGWYWSVGRHPAAEGPIEYRKNTLWSKRVMEDGLRGGGFWETDRRLESLFGVTMSGMTVSACTDFRKLPDAENPWDSWIFDGWTGGENFGSYGVDKNQGGACGYEFDKTNFSQGTPQHALIVETKMGKSRSICR